MHARDAPALPRARGGDRRRRAARAEPVLGGGRRHLRRRGGGARDARRPLSALTWALEAAPTERERVRALAQLAVASPEEARALADANDWGRRLARARSAFRRETRITNDALLSWLGSKTTFGVTELERFADCSSAWLFERIVSPKTIDAVVDPMLRGSVAHSTLHKFYRRAAEGARARPGDARERRAGGRLPPPLPRRRPARRRAARADRAAGGRARGEPLAGPRGLRARRVALAAAARAAPLRGRVRIGSLGARAAAGTAARRRPAPERQDRPDRRRPVQRARDRAGLQVGTHRALGEADRRGAEAPDPALHARAARPRRHRAARRRLPGARRRTRHARAAARRGRGRPAGLPEERLPGRRRVLVARRAPPASRARGYAQRIRAGDVKHDPKGGTCPSWCDLWTMCRIERA